jgi:hypothetical protein
MACLQERSAGGSAAGGGGNTDEVASTSAPVGEAGQAATPKKVLMPLLSCVWLSCSAALTCSLVVPTRQAWSGRWLTPFKLTGQYLISAVLKFLDRLAHLHRRYMRTLAPVGLREDAGHKNAAKVRCKDSSKAMEATHTIMDTHTNSIVGCYHAGVGLDALRVPLGRLYARVRAEGKVR